MRRVLQIQHRSQSFRIQGIWPNVAMFLWEQSPASYLWHRVGSYDGSIRMALECWQECDSGHNGISVSLVVAINYRVQSAVDYGRRDPSGDDGIKASPQKWE